MSDPRKGFPASVMLADGRLTVEPYRPSGRLGVSYGSVNGQSCCKNYSVPPGFQEAVNFAFSIFFIVKRRRKKPQQY